MSCEVWARKNEAVWKRKDMPLYLCHHCATFEVSPVNHHPLAIAGLGLLMLAGISGHGKRDTGIK